MSLRILQLTDLHLSADAGERLKGVPTHHTLRDVVDCVTSGQRSFDLVVVTGDLTHNGERKAYRAVRDILGDRCAPSQIIPGNHDDRDALRDVFAGVVPTASYTLNFSLRAGSWRLIGLDTLEVGSVSGSISADQLSWLAAELTADPGAPTAIFMHHPPVDIGCAWLDAIKLRNPDPFVRLVQSSPQVRLVCTGHVHLEAERKLGDATILTSPSTCVQFDRETGAEPILHHIPPGYRVLELQDDAFSTNVVRLPVLTYPPADAG